MQIPGVLEARLRLQLEGEYDEFAEACSRPPRTSYRVNTLKASIDDVTSVFDSEPVPWSHTGFYTEARVGDSIEHFQGLLYVQESASMLAAEVLDPVECDCVLDLTAAPGSKTTQMAAMMKNEGCIVANELDSQRLKTLRFNLNRMGVVNTVVSNVDGARFRSKMRFDRVLLDAPCSNLGQLRENPEALKSWSEGNVRRCAGVQRKLMDVAASFLKKDGVLVYSTCTFSPEENEAVVDHAIRKHGLSCEGIGGEFKSRNGLLEWKGKRYGPEVENSVRIYPHENDTGGFFAAKLRR
ncbi:MAG: NOL1/NOP2/sun family putative RNA methylase [Candidatus Altiarchaeales archaeon]|nr:NOL1/NOP2/sun family putative RNA methylase [Candidatus Altiarchaeales archaeon]MBD3415743.1 NOL1/NOP2/sun family putative RNA methylase [Candidatus Altiarchaeales archaeon]